MKNALNVDTNAKCIFIAYNSGEPSASNFRCKNYTFKFSSRVINVAPVLLLDSMQMYVKAIDFIKIMNFAF